LGRIPARLRSLLSRLRPDNSSDVEARLLAIDERMTALQRDAAEGRQAMEAKFAKVEADNLALKSLIRARDDRGQEKLKAGLSSIVNLLTILPDLRINGVVPPFPHQGFEITGEEAAFLFHLIRRHRPKLILELGSGSSTFLFAAAVRANGSGRVVSVEHDAGHAERTAQLLRQAGLAEWVQPVAAPLVERTIGSRTFHWYDLDPFLRTLTGKIDFLFVDGPPGKMQSLSRYPALPVIAPHLSEQALVFIDDGGREDETRMIALWRELDELAFTSESLGFLPRAPVLLTTTARTGRIAEFPLAREEPSDAEDEAEAFGLGRRSGTS